MAMSCNVRADHTTPLSLKYSDDELKIYLGLMDLQIRIVEGFAKSSGIVASMIRACPNLEGVTLKDWVANNEKVVRGALHIFEGPSAPYEIYVVPNRILNNFEHIAQSEPETCRSDALDPLTKNVNEFQKQIQQTGVLLILFNLELLVKHKKGK